jgi:hypothetical protein
MTRRDRIRIAKIAIVATLMLWGLLAGFVAGSKYQDTRDWPFSDLVTAVIGVMLVLSVALAIPAATRHVGRTVLSYAAAFVLSLLLGHLLGARMPGGPVVPMKAGPNAGGPS